MGRYSYSARPIVEGSLRINVHLIVKEIKRKLREKLPNASKAEISSYLARIIETEVFTASRDHKFFQSISFHKTPSNLGFGLRYWLLCPRCGRKVINLYFPPYGHRYLCRICHNLTYKSQKEHDKRVDRFIKSGLDLPPLSSLSRMGATGLCLLLKAQMKIESMDDPKGKDVDINIDFGSFGKK